MPQLSAKGSTTNGFNAGKTLEGWGNRAARGMLVIKEKRPELATLNPQKKLGVGLYDCNHSAREAATGQFLGFTHQPA